MCLLAVGNVQQLTAWVKHRDTSPTVEPAADVSQWPFHAHKSSVARCFREVFFMWPSLVCVWVFSFFCGKTGFHGWSSQCLQ